MADQAIPVVAVTAVAVTFGERAGRREREEGFRILLFLAAALATSQ